MLIWYHCEDAPLASNASHQGEQRFEALLRAVLVFSITFIDLFLFPINHFDIMVSDENNSV